MNTRDDIDPASTWVVSDTHFGHENIKGFCHRPSDIESTMMEEWARAVPDDATVVHLGDLCYKSNAFFKNMIAPHLTGARKLLVAGNHDRQRSGFYRDCGFKVIAPFQIDYDIHQSSGYPYRIQFSHYPWNEEYDNSPNPPSWIVRLHGHIHNNGYTREAFVPFVPQQINLSVEQTHYRPVNLKLLLDGYLFGSMPQHPGAEFSGAGFRTDQRPLPGDGEEQLERLKGNLARYEANKAT